MGTESNLSVLYPVEINDTTLTSTTVAEADYPAWSGVTTYNTIGDRVIKSHRIYENAKTGNLNKDPDDINNRAGSTIWWIDVSATNAWKMFDGESSSATTIATSLTVVVEPGFINSLAMLGLVGDQVDVTYKSTPGGTTVYNTTVMLENSYPPDYYEYFFSPFQQQPDLIIDDIPPYYNGELTVTLSATSGNVECGMFALGDLRPLGTIVYNAKATPKSYSYIKIDDFGNNEIRRRKSARDVSLETKIEIGYANTAIDILTTVMDQAVVWVGTSLDDYAGLRVLGLGNGQVVYDQPNYCTINVDIKGLI